MAILKLQKQTNKPFKVAKIKIIQLTIFKQKIIKIKREEINTKIFNYLYKIQYL